ncbi:MAG: radical SAM protein [Candidatus Tectimicrobiota bacterium]
MQPHILLVNPPIYDFSAYDFWLKPYGLLRLAGYLRGQADLALFDYLDRFHPQAPAVPAPRPDRWERGPFYAETVPKPPLYSAIPRTYRRYGLPRGLFQTFLSQHRPFDVALIQTVMTYWYPGIQEVIADLRASSPTTKIVLGGVYATLCPEHAQSLGADLVIERDHLEPLWAFLQLTPQRHELPLWEAYADLKVGVLKLADGCPFQCTYCSVPQVYPPFMARPLERSLAELAWLQQCGARQVAFYDDALLFKPDQMLIPFLQQVLQRGLRLHFHTPNALNARFISRDLATLMVQAGFQTFYLGFESSAYTWQRHTGGKVYAHELARAVEHLVQAGADIRQITAYLIIAHPQTDQQNVAASMHFAHSLGVRLMLSEFSPLPGTPDGERCRAWVDLDEPLWHNKTVFPFLLLGASEVQRLKRLCRELNDSLGSPARASESHA